MTSDLNPLSAENQAEDQVKRQVSAAGLTIFYDGECPLCRREIGFYQKRGSLSDVDWVDVSNCSESDIPTELSRDQALARFHVSLPDGSLRSGPRGFGVIWSRMKGFSWLGKILQMNSLQPILELLYKGFLVVRSMIAKQMGKH